jgi:hypothetical protein
MKRLAIISGFVAQSAFGWSQTANEILLNLRTSFREIRNLKCQVDMAFDIPGVSIDKISGKMFYKKPDRFRVKTKGLIFFPKQNPFQQLELIEDPSTYVAILSGEAALNGIKCHVINIIPNNPEDLVIIKMLVGIEDKRIHKSELTLKRVGTVTYHNTYTSDSAIIPTEMEFEADFRRFKMPKAISGDFSSKPVRNGEKSRGYETGKVTILISDLELNKKIDDSIFSETEEI